MTSTQKRVMKKSRNKLDFWKTVGKFSLLRAGVKSISLADVTYERSFSSSSSSEEKGS